MAILLPGKDAPPRIEKCEQCGSRFPPVADDMLCEECKKWAAILGEVNEMRKARL